MKLTPGEGFRQRRKARGGAREASAESPGASIQSVSSWEIPLWYRVLLHYFLS